MIRTLLLSLLFALVFPSLAHGYYNPSTGRWLNRDPAKEHPGSSLYSAGKNCFINGVDLLGLQFRVVYGFAPHGTLTNPNWEGRTWLTKEESMVLVPFRSLMLGLNCATIVVMSDYEYEVTSLLPPTVPPGYTENGLWTIIAHEAKRVAVYEAAYNAYLATARATVEGKTLCCCRLSAGALIGTWAETVASSLLKNPPIPALPG